MDKRVVSRHEYYKLFDVVLPESYLLLILDQSLSVEPEGEVSSLDLFLLGWHFVISIVQADGRQTNRSNYHNRVRNTAVNVRECTSVYRGFVGPLFHQIRTYMIPEIQSQQ